MSTYWPAQLYLIDVDGETREARYHLGIHQFVYLGSGQTIPNGSVSNVRPAIVLDPEDADVQTLMRGGLEVEELDTAALSLVHKIRAQITPPEPPMEEPTALGEKVKTDNGVAVIADDQSGHPWYLPSEKTWHHWGQLKNPRPYESPRQEPATAPQSDAQGSGSGIGRVSESEASEGAPAHAEAWVGITISRKDRP